MGTAAGVNGFGLMAGDGMGGTGGGPGGEGGDTGESCDEDEEDEELPDDDDDVDLDGVLRARFPFRDFVDFLVCLRAL